MFTIENARELIYISEDKTAIVMKVKFLEFDEELPFCAAPYDNTTHGVELFNRAIAGEFGPIADYAPAVATEPQPISHGTQTL